MVHGRRILGSRNHAFSSKAKVFMEEHVHQNMHYRVMSYICLIHDDDGGMRP